MSKKLSITIPKYSLSEELFNSISHGIGGGLGIAALVVMIIKAKGALANTTVSLFGATIILLYSMSCVYHGLSKNLEGKKVLRVLDHCNVFMLVLGTYIPASLIGVGGTLGWVLFGMVTFFTILGIVFTAIWIDKFQVVPVICHLFSGWSILFGISKLLANTGTKGVLYMILGGIMYTIGAALYGMGKKVKYMHCVFHIFCLLGTFFHFWAIYMYMI